ncbi:hypothetical protein [Acinetobacter sp. WCHAc010052]|uniref:hypothetical protein n=1 Tax=Acinetobacter sp. WCHAc010052 TaxID=2004647 RepID=UPI000B3D1625|nr:hypothetical protein [Acinetobacter sp. WCHAc010052]AXY61483.1 hypothetical protein CDG61_16655 [Acinetobacter sp. WCHAc010052]
MKNNKKLHIAVFCFLFSACQSQFVTTPNSPTEASLVADAVDNGLSAELDIPYVQAYMNLKQAYQHCIAFSAEKDFVFTDNRLEQHLEMGTLFARTEGGAYLQKTTVEALAPEKTRITLFLPAKFRFAQQRFKQDLRWAQGKDALCNHSPYHLKS